MNEVLDVVKGTLAGVHMRTEVQQIMAAGRSRRRRRRAAGAMAAGLGLATAAALAAMPSKTTTEFAPPATADAQGPVHLDLAAFSVNTNPDGTVTVLTKRQALDPVVLRHALARAGIPTYITIGRFCSDAGKGQPPGLDSVLHSERRADGTIVMVFTPSALVPGTEISIGMKPGSPGKLGAAFTLIRAGARLTCSTNLPH